MEAQNALILDLRSRIAEIGVQCRAVERPGVDVRVDGEVGSGPHEECLTPLPLFARLEESSTGVVYILLADILLGECAQSSMQCFYIISQLLVGGGDDIVHIGIQNVLQLFLLFGTEL